MQKKGCHPFCHSQVVFHANPSTHMIIINPVSLFSPTPFQQREQTDSFCYSQKTRLINRVFADTLEKLLIIMYFFGNIVPEVGL